MDKALVPGILYLSRIKLFNHCSLRSDKPAGSCNKDSTTTNAAFGGGWWMTTCGYSVLTGGKTPVKGGKGGITWYHAVSTKKGDNWDSWKTGKMTITRIA